MKAIVQDRYGSADVLALREVPSPALTDDRVLLRVQAASVNPLDWHLMRASPFLVRLSTGLRRPEPPIRGVDVAGRVEAVGSAVTRFAPGDEVFGFCAGAFAECVRGAPEQFVARPANVSPEEAAAVPVAATTALQGLRDLGRVEAGARVLILGAGGGVGTYAVQLARWLGAEVTGVCSTRNVERVRELGATRVIDYTKEPLSGTWDVVFQLAGTASPFALRRRLAPAGTLVLCSGEGRLGGLGRSLVALVASRFVSQRLVTWITSQKRDDLALLAELLAQGKIRSVIDRCYPLAEAPQAIRYVEQGHSQGKVVISMGARDEA